MQRSELLSWLRERDAARLEGLAQQADAVRRARVGDAVYLRALVEISNHCSRACHYCGLRAANRGLQRYRLTASEIMDCVRQAEACGLGTVVLQAGEDPALTSGWIADLVRCIKRETAMAVTLSLGERRVTELAEWREAGADRYLLRFETSNTKLYELIHPPRPGVHQSRLDLLKALRDLEYEVGSGVMVGLPGQSFEDLADDIDLFRDLELDMIGVGPFIPHPGTPLGMAGRPSQADEFHQVSNSIEMTCKVIALARLACPLTNIPSTTALTSLDPVHGRERALMCGANIVMPNFTPPRYRAAYEVYPGKACVHEEAETCFSCLEHRIRAIGRTIGVGRGDSPRRARRPAFAGSSSARSVPC